MGRQLKACLSEGEVIECRVSMVSMVMMKDECE